MLAEAPPHRPRAGQGAKRGKSGGSGMTDTQVLLKKIAALRQQLEQVDELAGEAPDRVRRLERQVAAGARQDVLLHGAVGQLAPAPTAPATTLLPKQLTARARRIL